MDETTPKEPARHYRLAESCIRRSFDADTEPEEQAQWLARGQVHALLALASDATVTAARYLVEEPGEDVRAPF